MVRPKAARQQQLRGSRDDFEVGLRTNDNDKPRPLLQQVVDPQRRAAAALPPTAAVAAALPLPPTTTPTTTTAAAAAPAPVRAKGGLRGSRDDFDVGLRTAAAVDPPKVVQTR